MEEDAAPEVVSGLALPEALDGLIAEEAAPVTYICGDVVPPVGEALDAPGNIGRVQMHGLIVGHDLLDLVHGLLPLQLEFQLLNFLQNLFFRHGITSRWLRDSQWLLLLYHAGVIFGNQFPQNSS